MKRSIVIAGHKTSVSLEDQFWNALKDIANHPGYDPLGSGGGDRTRARMQGNLSSAIRLFVLEKFLPAGRL